MQNSKFIKILVAVAVLVAVAYIVTAFVFLHNRKNKTICQEAQIHIFESKNRQLVTENDIRKMLADNGLNTKDKKMSELKTDNIEHVLAKNPSIRNVECYVSVSGAVHIDVKQRKPVFRVLSSENYYVDTERKTMPLSNIYSAYVPVVSGVLTKSFATGELFNFVNYIEKNDFWQAQIVQIYVENQQHIELVTRVGDALVILGDLKDYEKKLHKLKTLYEKAFNQMGWNDYKTIDLRYKNQIVCTKIGMVQ